MGLALYPGFDFAKIGNFSLIVTDSGGTSTIVATSNGIDNDGADAGSESTTTTWAQVDFSGVEADFSAFAAILEQALDNDGTLTGNYTVTFNESSLTYTILSSPGSATIEAGTNALARNILGLAEAGAIGPFTSTSSTRTPYYCIEATVGARSADSGIFEPDNLFDEAEDDDGNHYTVGPDAAPKYRDFSITHEPLAAVFKDEATSAVPWTYEHFWEHTRSVEPFVVVDDALSYVAFLRAKGASFRPSRVVADYDGEWILKFRTRVKGTLNSVSAPT